MEGGALGSPSIIVPEGLEERVINLEKLISNVSGKHFPLSKDIRFPPDFPTPVWHHWIF